MGIDSYHNSTEQKETNPLLKAKENIEKKLLGLEEKLGIYALQASLAGDYQGKVPDTTITSSDGFNSQKENDIKRFYRIDSYRAYGTREFTFDCLGNKSLITYDFAQRIDDQGNLLPVYDRFSEKYTATVGNNQYSFENIEDCINFTFHMHRALHFKKENHPVVFKNSGNRIEIQTTQKTKSGDLKVQKSNYYRSLPDTLKLGLSKNTETTFRNKEQTTETKLSPKIDIDGNVSIETETEVVEFNQGYTNNYSLQTTTKNKTKDTDIYTKIINTLNNDLKKH